MRKPMSERRQRVCREPLSVYEIKERKLLVIQHILYERIVVSWMIIDIEDKGDMRQRFILYMLKY